MSLKKIFLLKLLLCMFASVFTRRDTLSYLPVSKAQLKDLAQNVCEDLMGLSAKTCVEGFNVPDKSVPSPRNVLQLRCHKKEMIVLNMKPSQHRYLVVLVPGGDPPDYNVRLSYNIVNPGNRSIELFSGRDKQRIFSSILSEDGTHSMWVEGPRINEWVQHTDKKYDISVDFKTASDEKLDGVISWNQIGEYDECFNVMGWCDKSGGFYMDVKPDTPTSVVFKNLHKNDLCNAKVMGKYGETKISFNTAAEDEIDTDPITEEKELPLDLNNTSPKNISVQAVSTGQEWSVRVNWTQPRLIPDSYNVTIYADYIHTLVVDGNATEVTFNNVSGADLYDVGLVSMYGHIAAHTSRRAIFPSKLELKSPVPWRWTHAAVAGAAWGAVAVAALTLAWIRLRRRTPPPSSKTSSIPVGDTTSTGINKGAKMDPDAYHDNFRTESVETRSEETPKLDPAAYLIPPVAEVKPFEETLIKEPSVCESTASDKWEVMPETVKIHEKIGEGAFGVVRRGTLEPKNKEVAVKMLKEFPSLEEKRAFHLEMELMKSVVAHPHVVSLIGCCSGHQPLIIAEYCSRGDLLSYLRKAWELLIPKRHRHAKNLNNNLLSSKYHNDMFNRKVPQEESRLVVNKLYEIQTFGDIELTARDLISFCRQIAMGMEFLAANKLVHRDLAARNILVTGDKMMKIADFGLSRDVYEDNQYKQKSTGKMPVRWMALESLSRRIYTSQSDVWSFGVVMWEIVTLGENPYADVSASELPQKLRAGHRLPNPPNCSDQFYELMLMCWVEQPRQRPNFTELLERLDELLNSACADTYLTLDADKPLRPTPLATEQRKRNFFLKAKNYLRLGSVESYESSYSAERSSKTTRYNLIRYNSQNRYNQYTTTPHNKNILYV